MHRRLILLRPRADLADESFYRHGRMRHAPLVAALPGLVRYRQHLSRMCMA